MTTYILYQALTAWLAVSKYKKGEFKNEKTDRIRTCGVPDIFPCGLLRIRKQRNRGCFCSRDNRSCFHRSGNFRCSI